MLLNFDDDFVQPKSVKHHMGRTAQTTFLTQQGNWDWRTLRDYVVSEIEDRFGAWDRNMEAEFGTFSSFVKRWGIQSESIARYAFEIRDGFVNGKPIRVGTFCKPNDSNFAGPISETLLELQAA